MEINYCNKVNSVRQKTYHPIFVHNFGKCRVITKILSLLNSARNLQYRRCNISHRTYYVVVVP